MTDTDSAWNELVRHLVEASDKEVKPEEVRPETKLRDDLDLGSLQAITLVMDLEEKFGIEVEDEELEGLESVGDIRDLIQAKLAQAGGGAE